MKAHRLAVVICSLMLGCTYAGADQHPEGHHSWTDQSGGQIQGSEGLEARVALTATDNGPAGASGWAKIEADNEEGAVTASIDLRVQGLPDGDYVLAVTRASDGSVVTLDQFTLGSSGGSGQQDMQGSESGSESHHQQDGRGSGSEVRVDLPADLDPTDIAQVGVADTSGALLLSGDVANTGSTVQYKAHVRLKAGRGAPAGNGTAAVQTTVRNGKAASRYSLQAAGVPANSQFYLVVNGKVVARTRSGPRGRVILQNLPAAQRIKSLGLSDTRGRAVVVAHF